MVSILCPECGKRLFQLKIQKKEKGKHTTYVKTPFMYCEPCDRITKIQLKGVDV